MSRADRLATAWRTFVAALVSCLLLAAPLTARAGSEVAEMEYNFPCLSTFWNGALRLDYGGISDAAVSLEFRGEQPVLVANERLAVEQPFEVVAFEYFSACEMARLIDNAAFRDVSRSPEEAEDVLMDVDCLAVYQLEREGILRSFEAYDTLIGYLYDRKGDFSYLGVPFWVRAENLLDSCDF